VRQRQGLIALAFLAPALVCLAVLRIVPAISAVVESFYTESLLRGGRVFAGLGNYTDLLSNKDFRQSVGVTLTADNHRHFWLPEGFAHGF